MDDSQSGKPEVAGDVPLRADAVRNRARILHAARRLYARDGLGVSMAAIAREAEVGKATLFRHFGTVPELVGAAFRERMDAYLAASDEALAQDDAWAGFVDFLVTVCEMQAMDRGFADVLTTTLPGAETFEERRLLAYKKFLEIIDRARQTGNLRADFVSQDLVLVLMANAGVIATSGAAASDSWRRLVGHLLRSFAAVGAPTPDLPPPPSDAELYRAMARAPLRK